MSAPKRIQLRPTAGWRKPEDAIFVARPTRWGNPYRIGAPHPIHHWPMSRDETIVEFREWMRRMVELQRDARTQLAGHDLACWCPLDQPCHADVLLELANS